MTPAKHNEYKFDDVSGLYLRDLRAAAAKSPIEGGLRRRLRHYRSVNGAVNSYGETFSIDTKIAAHTSPNAACQKAHDTFQIIINDGLITQLDDVFVALANASNDARWFDVNHSFDKTKLDHIPGFDARLTSSYKAQYSVGSRRPLSSANEGDAVVAGFLAFLATRFVSDHEFFHAFNGHFGVLKKLGRLSWTEMNWQLSDQSDRDFRHALEMSADRNAFLQCATELTRGYLPLNDIVKEWSLAEQLAACALAPVIVLALWASEAKMLDVQTSPTHPGGVERIHSIVDKGIAFTAAIPEVGLQTALSARELLISFFERAINLHWIFEPIGDAIKWNFDRCHVEASRLDIVFGLYLSRMLRKHAFAAQQRLELGVTNRKKSDSSEW